MDAKTGEAVAGSVPRAVNRKRPRPTARATSSSTSRIRTRSLSSILRTLRFSPHGRSLPARLRPGWRSNLARRLFIGCHNNMMAVMDYSSGKVVTTIPIGPGIDTTAFDPATGTAFSSSAAMAPSPRPMKTPGPFRRGSHQDASRSAHHGARHLQSQHIYRHRGYRARTSADAGKSPAAACRCPIRLRC